MAFNYIPERRHAACIAAFTCRPLRPVTGPTEQLPALLCGIRHANGELVGTLIGIVQEDERDTQCIEFAMYEVRVHVVPAQPTVVIHPDFVE
jgi:hypothetical protein